MGSTELSLQKRGERGGYSLNMTSVVGTHRSLGGNLGTNTRTVKGEPILAELLG